MQIYNNFILLFRIVKNNVLNFVNYLFYSNIVFVTICHCQSVSVILSRDILSDHPRHVKHPPSC